MALSANTVVEVRTAGSDTNGGGFVTGASGTDFSIFDSKRTAPDVTNISVTNGVGNGTTTFTSATANFSTAIVGNIIYLQGGTGSLAAGWYQVTARASTTSITLDRSVASGTGITVNIGGALASLGQAGATAYGLVSGARIFVKTGTYTISSATVNVSGGCFSSSLGTLNIIGYDTGRGYSASQTTPMVHPLLQAPAISTFTLINMTGASSQLYGIGMDCQARTSSRGCVVRGQIFNCYVLSPTNGGFVKSTTTTASRCYVTGAANVAAFGVDVAMDCYAGDGTVVGFALAASQVAIRCIADTNTGATTDGFTCAGMNVVTDCISYGNGRNGFLISGANNIFTNCIEEENGTNAWDLASNVNQLLLFYGRAANNANTAGKGVEIAAGENSGGGGATYFVDAANKNFALNGESATGGLMRGTGYPGLLPVGGRGWKDRGTLQTRTGMSKYGFP